jgi:hypothetical protein
MLDASGVTGEPVDPTTSAAALLGKDTDPAFLTGSVQPVTLRSMIATLIHALPPAELVVVGAIMRTAGDIEYAAPGDAAGRPLQKQKAMDFLMRMPSPALDSCPAAPLFYVHLGASQRSIGRDAEDQVRRWKRRRGIDERRVQINKLPLYLRVWDLREGWTGSGYDVSRERSFQQIAQELREPLSTVANRYRSAFEMVTGHEFKPGLWWRLMMPLKYRLRCSDPAQALSAPMRHRLLTPSRRPVPDSVISPPTEQARAIGTVERESSVDGDWLEADLRMDVAELTARGLPDAEIARRLGLCDEADVAILRARFSEFQHV